MSSQILISQLSSFSFDEDKILSSSVVGIDFTNTAQSSAGSVVTFSVSSLTNYVLGASADEINGLISTVNANSAVNWNYQGTDIKTLSGNWQSTFTTVQSNSANWVPPTIEYSSITLTATSALTFDTSVYDEFVVTLSGSGVSANFGFPVNGTDRQTVLWEVRFLSNTARVNLSSNFRLPTTTLNWSNSAGRFDYMAAKYNQTDNRWYVVSFIPGYII